MQVITHLVPYPMHPVFHHIVSLCGSDLRRGRTRKHGTPQTGTDDNSAFRSALCSTRDLLSQPSAGGAICGNGTHSPTRVQQCKDKCVILAAGCKNRLTLRFKDKGLQIISALHLTDFDFFPDCF